VSHVNDRSAQALAQIKQIVAGDLQSFAENMVEIAKDTAPIDTGFRRNADTAHIRNSVQAVMRRNRFSRQHLNRAGRNSTRQKPNDRYGTTGTRVSYGERHGAIHAMRGSYLVSAS